MHFPEQETWLPTTLLPSEILHVAGKGAKGRRQGLQREDEKYRRLTLPHSHKAFPKGNAAAGAVEGPRAAKNGGCGGKKMGWELQRFGLGAHFLTGRKDCPRSLQPPVGRISL